MTLWDTHCHLADPTFAADLGDVLARARAVGVEGVLVVGTEPASWRAGQALLATLRAAGLEAGLALGLHPHEARAAGPELWEELKAALRAPGAWAVGEMGLDYHYDHALRRQQQEAFRTQLDLARSLNVPIVLHEREAAADMLAILREVGLPARGGVWHCFSGAPELAATAVRLGLHLGFGGLATFRNAEPIQEALRQCPRERLLLETDAPYLAPVPHRGRRNEPSFLAATLQRVAALRGEDAEELGRNTAANARALLVPDGGASG